MENKDNTIVVKDAKRLVGRNINERFDGDLYREIAELITNSLDSYSRLKDFSGERIVRVELHKPQRKNKEKYTIRVIDNAEGMSLETLTKIFSVRGEDNNQGESFDRVRGMFGLGASDVMRVSAYQEKSAEYYSFRDGKASGLRFNMDEDKTSTTITPFNIEKEEQIAGLRNKYGIPDNGTVAIFGIPDEVNIPSNFEEFKRGLESVFLLRNILMNDDNIIKLDAFGENGRLSTNSPEYKLEEPFYSKDFSFTFKKREFIANLKFYKNKYKETNGIEILVQDSRDVIYDNQPQMFGFKKSQGAEVLSGILTIENFYEELDYFLNERNISLLKDDRSGFDINKGFGRILTIEVDPFIREAFNIATKENRRENTSLSGTKNYREFLSFLNKDLKSTQVIGSGHSKEPKTSPSGAIDFVRSKITITAGKKYDLKLDINKELINSGDIIEINAYGNEQQYVSFTSSIEINDDDLVGDIPQKSILIEGLKASGDSSVLLTASCNGTTCRCEIKVIEEEIIYPQNGIEFEKHEMTIVPDVRHKKIKLYFDRDSIDDELVMISDNSNGKLTFKETLFDINQGVMLNETIGYLVIDFSGGDLNDEYNIVATCGKLSDVLKAKVSVSSSEVHGNKGDIADYELCDDDYLGQSFYDPRDHKIKILTKNVINNQFVKEWKSNLSGKDLLYVISLVCYEAAKLHTDKEKSNGHIAENDIEDYLNRLATKKDEYFEKFITFAENKK